MVMIFGYDAPWGAWLISGLVLAGLLTAAARWGWQYTGAGADDAPPAPELPAECAYPEGCAYPPDCALCEFCPALGRDQLDAEPDLDVWADQLQQTRGALMAEDVEPVPDHVPEDWATRYNAAWEEKHLFDVWQAEQAEWLEAWRTEAGRLDEGLALGRYAEAWWTRKAAA